MGPVRIALAALLSLLLLHTTGAQGFAAMSIDFGSKFMKIGLVKPGVPMEIVLNKESRRKTPSLVHIRNGERAFGDPALALAARYPTTVYGNLVDLVAKSLDHPLVEQYLRDYPQLKLVAHENRSTVAIPFGENVYSIESVLAMILSHARAATEAFAEQTVKDAVISVPAFFNQAERQAIADAAKIAKLNLLQLVNDGTAAALGYGVFRRKEITEKPQRLLIYDMGAAKTEATLVEYKIAKDKKGYKEPHVIVLGVGYDRTLGGEVFTLRMRELLVEKFRAHYKTENDVTTNPKGMMKMYKEAERVKQVLSANADHFAQIESVHEDKDMRVKVTRDELNALIAGYEKRMARPVKDALEMAGLGIDQVDQVVLMGAGTRVPRVQDVLQAAVGGKELGRFLNTDEAIAMGGLYQAAHLSKGFKVKPFYVDELQMLPIQVHFVSRQKNDATGEMTEKPVEKAIFGYKSKYPTGRKVMSFTSYTDDFSFSLHYGDLSHLSDEQKKLMGSSQISDVAISGLKKALEEKVNSEENEFKGVKAAFSMDYSGLVHIEGAEAIIEKKPKGVVESLTNTISGFFGSDSKKEEGEPTEEASPNGEQGSNDENVEKQDEASEADGSEAKPKETGKKNDEPSPEEAETSKSKKEEAKEADSSTEKKSKDSADKKDKNATKDEKKEDVPAVVKVKLAVAELRKDSQPTGVEERKAAIKILEQFEREERLREERHHAENELESYAFEASLLPEDDNFIAHSRDEERENLQKEATRVRAWLEDDTDPSTPTDDFRANLHKLKDIVVPVKKRIEEAQTRPAAVADLEKLINSTLGLITITRQNITATEIESMDKSLKAMNDEVDGFAAKVDKLVSWLVDKKEAQDKLTVKDDPVLKTEELKNKAAALQRAFTQHYSKMTRLADDAAKARKKAEREAKKKEREEKEKAAKAEGAAETIGGEESTSEKKPEVPAAKVDEPSKKDDAKETDSKTEL